MPIAPSDWLDLTIEAPLDPERVICDPHHHLWDHALSRYLLDELVADTAGGHHVASTVFVECASMYRAGGPDPLRPVGETEFVQGVAAQSASGGYGALRAASGIVSHADLLLGHEADEVLEAHENASRNRFRGIRHSAAWDPSDEIRRSHSAPPPQMLLRDDFRRGFEKLAARGLTFDAWLYHPQLPELTDLARSFPDASIILDHVGGPLGIGPYQGKREAVFEIWQGHIADLAQCANVSVKLGGLAMPICGFGWHKRKEPPGSSELADAFAPYFRHCIDRFGAQRCMFESNFPVDKASCSYTVLWNSFKRIAADRSEAERAALFHDTAVRVYRL